MKYSLKLCVQIKRKHREEVKRGFMKVTRRPSNWLENEADDLRKTQFDDKVQSVVIHAFHLCTDSQLSTYMYSYIGETSKKHEIYTFLKFKCRLSLLVYYCRPTPSQQYCVVRKTDLIFNGCIMHV